MRQVMAAKRKEDRGREEGDREGGEQPSGEAMEWNKEKGKLLQREQARTEIGSGGGRGQHKWGEKL